MRVLSHRGYWKTREEKNAPSAFERSFGLGFGTETDLRDLGGALVVAHDPPLPGAMGARDLFEVHRRLAPQSALALNIKADGLQKLVKPLLDEYEVQDAFVFDMSIPDTVQWAKLGVPFFTRHSDVEPEPNLYAEAAGVWLDAFHGDWWDVDVLDRHLDAGKRICIVSPDLHGRAVEPVWQSLAKRSDLVALDGPELMICTDMPEQAAEVLTR